MQQSDPANAPSLRGPLNSYSVEFDQKWLHMPIPAALLGATHMTWAMWVKRIGTFSAYDSFPNIFMCSVSGGSTTSGGGFCRHNIGDALTYSRCGQDGRLSISVGIPESEFPLDQWVHVAAVDTPTQLKFFKNGVLEHQRTTSTGGFPSSAGSFELSAGASFDGSRPTPVALSDLRIYDRALEDAEIPGLMERAVAPFDPNLRVYVPL